MITGSFWDSDRKVGLLLFLGAGLLYLPGLGLAVFAACLRQTMTARRAAWLGAFAALAIVAGWALVRGLDLTYQMIYDVRYEVVDWFREHARPGDQVGYYGATLKLPALDEEVAARPMPGQLVPLGRPELAARDPEFLMVIPQQEYEPVHEWSLPAATYQALRDGSLGYAQVLGVQTPSLFSERPITYVNPPVKVFVRKDHLATLSDLRPILEVDH